MHRQGFMKNCSILFIGVDQWLTFLLLLKSQG